jgi:hypothetical protein
MGISKGASMTSEHMKRIRDEPYYGRVIDGPFEGEWIGSDTPHFVGHFQQQLYALYTGWDAGIEVSHVIYRWLPGYRAWAWWQ